MQNANKFTQAYALDVSEYVEKKNGFLYLSWAKAWAEFKKIYPDATYQVNDWGGNYCTGNDKIGYMVQTQVTVGEQTYEMWLPVMDARNHTILQPKMTEINKAIMRCLTKNLAMFGLGLYLYAGEDLPETVPPTGPITQKELREVWGVTDVKKTIEWFEKKFSAPMKEWTKEMIGDARILLEAQKAKRSG